MKKFWFLVVILVLFLTSNASATPPFEIPPGLDKDNVIVGIDVDASNKVTNTVVNTNLINNSAKADANAKSYSDAAALSLGFFNNDFTLNQEFQRAPIETVQPNNSAMPLATGGFWNYADKMKIGGDVLTKPAYTKIITHRYTFDWTEFLLFRKIRLYDVPRIVLSLTEANGSAELQIICFDGSEAAGLPMFLGGGGSDSTGLSTITGSMMPTANQSNVSPVCVINEYVK